MEATEGPDSLLSETALQELIDSCDATHWCICLRFHTEEEAPPCTVFPSVAFLNLLDQGRLNGSTLVCGVKATSKPDVPLPPSFFRPLEYVLALLHNGHKYKAITEKDLLKGAPYAGWCRTPVISGTPPVSAPEPLDANDRQLLAQAFSSAGCWCYVERYHYNKSPYLIFTRPPDALLDQALRGGMSMYTPIMGVWEAKPRERIRVPVAMMVTLGHLLEVLRAGRQYHPLTLEELRDARDSRSLAGLMNREGVPLPPSQRMELDFMMNPNQLHLASLPPALLQQSELHWQLASATRIAGTADTASASSTASVPIPHPPMAGQSTSRAAGAPGEGGDSRDRGVIPGAEFLEASASHRRPLLPPATSSLLPPPRAPLESSDPWDMEFPSLPSAPPAAAGRAAAQTAAQPLLAQPQRAQPPPTQTSPRQPPPAQEPPSQMVVLPLLPHDTRPAFLGDAMHGCRPAFEGSPLRLFFGPLGQYALTSNWWFVDPASFDIMGPYSAEQMLMGYTFSRELAPDTLVCGAEQEPGVEPSQSTFPASPYYEKLGELLSRLDEGASYALVTVEELQNSEAAGAAGSRIRFNTAAPLGPLSPKRLPPPHQPTTPPSAAQLLQPVPQPGTGEHVSPDLNSFAGTSSQPPPTPQPPLPPPRALTLTELEAMQGTTLPAPPPSQAPHSAPAGAVADAQPERRFSSSLPAALRQAMQQPSMQKASMQQPAMQQPAMQHLPAPLLAAYQAGFEAQQTAINRQAAQAANAAHLHAPDTHDTPSHSRPAMHSAPSPSESSFPQPFTQPYQHPYSQPHGPHGAYPRMQYAAYPPQRPLHPPGGHAPVSSYGPQYASMQPVLMPMYMQPQYYYSQQPHS